MRIEVACGMNFHIIQIEWNSVETCSMGQGCSKKKFGMFLLLIFHRILKEKARPASEKPVTKKWMLKNFFKTVLTVAIFCFSSDSDKSFKQ